ncbi:hypothetical protein HJO_12831 [Hyphomonas johnsonii MHS-2]|uniref:TetR family transcriptional regulator n=1 Tax=Hyphomonas johnsonii MHS-2 TaxID=1280950 RepID=A0A059FJM5_9PROT|nr:hypothetical protein HJO_12831 [Hyphomonas johnsonii MHS-2]
MTNHALDADLRRPSLRQFAIAAGASEPTLRHYFGDRQGVVVAILENIGRRGTPIWNMIAEPAETPTEALEQYFRIAETGMRHANFTRAHAFGLIEGIAEEKAGKAYLRHILEPALKSIMDKLGNTPNGPTSENALRAAAMAAMAPLLVMSIHQDLLGGDTEAPIDSQSMIRNIQAWLGAGITT